MFDFVKVHRWVRRFQMEGLIGIEFGVSGRFRGEWSGGRGELHAYAHRCIVAKAKP